jgi:hypothetical protein
MKLDIMKWITPMKKILFVALGLGFLLFGIEAYLQGRPTPKNERIHQAVQPYNPYYIEKRFGGLQIRSKMDKEYKEKPKNIEVFHRLEYLEKEWAKTHLTLNGSTLVIHDQEGKELKTIELKTADEKSFVHTFYGLQ